MHYGCGFFSLRQKRLSLQTRSRPSQGNALRTHRIPSLCGSRVQVFHFGFSLPLSVSLWNTVWNSGVSSSSHLPLISSIAFLGSACFSHFQDYIFKTVQIHIKWLEMRSTGAEFNLAKCMNSVSRMTERDASFKKKKTNARLLIKFLFVLNGYERARLFGCACCCQGNEHSPEYCSY